MVITGEGRGDWQTAHGKTPVGIAKAAKKFNLPVIALACSLGENYQATYQHGIDVVFAVTPRPDDLNCALAEAKINIPHLAENMAITYNINQSCILR